MWKLLFIEFISHAHSFVQFEIYLIKKKREGIIRNWYWLHKILCIDAKDLLQDFFMRDLIIETWFSAQ